MMKQVRTVGIVYDEAFRYFLDLSPAVWQCKLYQVTEEEYAKLVQMQADYARWQSFLGDIASRPEWDAIGKRIGKIEADQ